MTYVRFAAAVFLATVFGRTTCADDAKAPLSPLMVVADEMVYENDFAKAAPLRNHEWQSRQGTRWEIADGVLRGQPSTAEYQAARTHHQGFEPRISAPIAPDEFLMQGSFRFVDGRPNSIVPFIEFMHHRVRVQFTRAGIALLADQETVKLAESSELKLESGKWYTFLAELRGEEFVIQFVNGPTLFGTHPSLAKKYPIGAKGFGLAGPQGGIAEIDNIKIWSVSPDTRPGWTDRRERFPTFTPVTIKEKKGE